MKISKIVILTFVLLLLISNAYAQLDTTIWDDVKIYENSEMSVEVPSKWRYFSDLTNEKFPFWFEGSGFGYPPFTANGSLVAVTILVTKMGGDLRNLDEVTKDIQDGYTKNPDRVFPEGPTSQVESFVIKSGETANLVSTRFYRKSKGLEQSRFDLALYNEKTKNAYMYTFIVLYGDKTYELEKDFGIRDYAKRIYSRFSFK